MVRPQAHHLHIKAGATPYDLNHLVGQLTTTTMSRESEKGGRRMSPLTQI